MRHVAMRAEQACGLFVRLYVGTTILVAAAAALAAPAALAWAVYLQVVATA